MCKKYFLGLFLAVCILSSCDSNLRNDSLDGALLIHFPSKIKLPEVPLASVLSDEDRRMITSAEGDVEVKLDTNDFILSVTNSAGASLYYGTFGAAPQKIVTQPGTYTVSAKSCDFYTPVFSCPQFGDSKVALVKAGKECSVLLDCEQLNCGIRLLVDPDFLYEYPKGVMFLKSSEGKLMYGYSEKRIAYFRPGMVSLVLNNDGKETTIATYKLAAKDMLNVKLEVSKSSSELVGAGIHIQVDTVRNWKTDRLVIGGDNSGSKPGGNEKEDAVSVSEARDLAGETDVWVYGYIVGGDLSSSKCSFQPPFTSKTNFVIAEKSSCTDRDNCLSVQLSTGKIRDALNLVDNPGLIGKKIYLKGDIVASYYGIPGIQAISEYSF